MQSKSSSMYAQSASASGPIEIYETDVHGKFVKLYNTGDEVRHHNNNEDMLRYSLWCSL